jgi:alpha-L-fucosidase 2
VTLNQANLPTNQRIQRVRDGQHDNSLTTLLFNHGRYLLIAISLSGLPSDLQGIWNQHFMPVWGSKHTININAEMNCWPAETTKSLNATSHSSRTSPLWRRTAPRPPNRCTVPRLGLAPKHRHPGRCSAARSRAAGHILDTERRLALSAPVDHYLFTRDDEFLRWAYPILSASAAFFMDFLIEKDDGRWLVTGPSISAENKYIIPGTDRTASLCEGQTWDNVG